MPSEVLDETTRRKLSQNLEALGNYMVQLRKCFEALPVVRRVDLHNRIASDSEEAFGVCGDFKETSQQH